MSDLRKENVHQNGCKRQYFVDWCQLLHSSGTRVRTDALNTQYIHKSDPPPAPKTVVFESSDEADIVRELIAFSESIQTTTPEFEGFATAMQEAATLAVKGKTASRELKNSDVPAVLANWLTSLESSGKKAKIAVALEDSGLMGICIEIACSQKLPRPKQAKDPLDPITVTIITKLISHLIQVSAGKTSNTVGLTPVPKEFRKADYQDERFYLSTLGVAPVHVDDRSCDALEGQDCIRDAVRRLLHTDVLATAKCLTPAPQDVSVGSSFESDRVLVLLGSRFSRVIDRHLPYLTANAQEASGRPMSDPATGLEEYIRSYGKTAVFLFLLWLASVFLTFLFGSLKLEMGYTTTELGVLSALIFGICTWRYKGILALGRQIAPDDNKAMKRTSFLRFGPSRIISRSKLGFWLGPTVVLAAMVLFAVPHALPHSESIEEFMSSLSRDWSFDLEPTRENASYLSSFSKAIWPLAVIGFGLLMQGHTELRDISARFADDQPQKRVLSGLSDIVGHARLYMARMTRVFQFDHPDLKPELKKIVQSLPDLDGPARAIELAANHVSANIEKRKSRFLRKSATTVALFGIVAGLGPLQDLVPSGWSTPVGETLAKAYGIPEEHKSQVSATQGTIVASMDPFFQVPDDLHKTALGNCLADLKTVNDFRKEHEFFAYILGLQNRCAQAQADYATYLTVAALNNIANGISKTPEHNCYGGSCTASFQRQLADLRTSVDQLSATILDLQSGGQFNLAVNLNASDVVTDNLIKYVFSDPLDKAQALRVPVAIDIQSQTDPVNFEDAWIVNAIRDEQHLELGVDLALKNIPTFRGSVDEAINLVSPQLIPVAFEFFGHSEGLARLPKGCRKEPVASFFFDSSISENFSSKMGNLNAMTQQLGPAPAQDVVNSLLVEFKDQQSRKLFLLGTTDTVGNVLLNQDLAERRAGYVSRQLRSLGDIVLPHQGIGEAFWMMGRKLNAVEDNQHSRAVHVFDCE